MGGISDIRFFVIFQKILVSIFIGNLCVPLFFLISGYLFFLKNQQSYSLADYVTKNKKRVASLVIPYIIGNCVFAIRNYYVSGLTMADFVKGFWVLNSGCPHDPPLCKHPTPILAV